MSEEEEDAPGIFTSFERDAEGALMVRLDRPPTYDAFESWAFDLVRRTGATIAERVDGPDARLWRLAYGDEELTFLHAGEQGTFLIAYQPSAERVLRDVRAMLESIAARIQPRDE